MCFARGEDTAVMETAQLTQSAEGAGDKIMERTDTHPASAAALEVCKSGARDLGDAVHSCVALELVPWLDFWPRSERHGEHTVHKADGGAVRGGLRRMCSVNHSL